MGVYRGSISNLSAGHRLGVVFMGLVLPPVMVIITLVMAFQIKWWPVLLVPTLLAMIIGLSVWGNIIKGQQLDFKREGMAYRKGFQKGSVAYDRIIKVYQVSLSGKSSTLIVFKEKDNSQPKCYMVEQTFSEKDKVSILGELISHCQKGGFDIIDDAPLQLIRKEKSRIGWVQI